MAEKGAREKFYDIAFRMYVEGKNLTEIEASLGVSRQTLSAWKADSKRPQDDVDEWDRARQQKRDNVTRLRDLFDRELSALENSAAGSLNNVNLDAITKLGTLVQRWEQMGRADELKSAAAKSALFLEFLRDLIAYAQKSNAMTLADAIEDNFDDIVAWGQQKYGVA